MDSCTFRTVSYRYLCSSQMPAVHLDSFSTLCKNENAGIGCIPVLLILCVPVSTKHTMQSALCLHRVSWADPADERQTCLWPPVPQIVSEVMPLFTYLSALSLSFLFSSSLSLFVETSMQPCPLCRKLSGAAVCLFKIAYMAGSCKRRPGNTSQQHYWFSPSHGLLFLLDLWIYI